MADDSDDRLLQARLTLVQAQARSRYVGIWLGLAAGVLLGAVFYVSDFTAATPFAERLITLIGILVLIGFLAVSGVVDSLRLAECRADVVRLERADELAERERAERERLPRRRWPWR